MNAVAQAIGYVVMVGCGILFAVGCVAWAFGRAWAQVRAAIAWNHLRQAVREWHENHPDLSKKWHGDRGDR